jgi:hypothetical protein
MPESRDDTIERPAAFFLDTNILDSLPETLESGELGNLIRESKKCGCRVFLCDVVAREWLKHRWDKALSILQSVEKGSKYLADYTDNVHVISVARKDLYERVFKKGIQRIKALDLRILPPPPLFVRTITKSAVFALPPFSHSNKGFKDELIVLTMLRLIHNWSYKTCVLVTNDNHFVESKLCSRFEPLRVKFKVVDSLQNATQLLIDTLNEEDRLYYEQIQTAGVKHANDCWDQICSAIIESVEAEGVYDYRMRYGEKYSSLDGTPKRVIDAVPLKITSITPGGYDEAAGAITSMTVSVDVELELEYEQMEFNWGEVFGRRIKTVEENESFKPKPYVRVTRKKIVSASIEAASRLSDTEWEGFEIKSVSI